VRRIETGTGEVLFEADTPDPALVLDQRTYGRIHDLLVTNVREGTGRRAAVPGLETGGKTGTTNDFRDAWFAGFSGDLVAVVWTGNDDNAPTERATGGGPPARVFGAFLRAAPRSGLGVDLPVARLAEPVAPAPRPVAEAVTAAEPAESEPATERDDPIGAFLSGLGGNER